MQVSERQFKTIDEYISRYPKKVRDTLEELRCAIREAAPEAQETINYGVPTFKLKGNLIHFAAYKKHISIYPGATAIEAFKEELTPYKLSKGTIQFPIDKPIPLDLVKKIVKFRIEENMSKKK